MLAPRDSIRYALRMESRSRKKTTANGPEERRTRTRNLVIRFNDGEREMLDVVAVRMHLNVSETVRHHVRREFEKGAQRSP